MCGLTGIVVREPSDLSDIDSMNAAQAHRGPDGGGVFVMGADGTEIATAVSGEPSIGRVALGHQRLSILDLSESGDQPMRSRDGRFVIVYNGEIYNYLELRAELAALGHTFEGTSDTEVLLTAFVEWGTRCFERCNGMWALAILDCRDQTLTLSRDRFGVKPLHYCDDGGRLLFASELKSILAVRRTPPRLCRQQAVAYLRDSLVNDSELTFVEGVSSFPPAHFAVIDLACPTSVSPQRYWSLPEGEELGQTRMPASQADDHFRDLLTSSVSLRLRSDVQVGTCLSGGLDSSTILCIASGLLDDGPQMQAFTAGFDDAALDERRYAEAAAVAAGARQNVVVPDADGLDEDWSALVRAQDEPFGSLSIYAQWCVMRLARQTGIKVLLDGQGGDEIMAGYRKYVVVHLLQMMKRRQFGAASSFLLGTMLRGDRGLLKISQGKRYLPGFLKSGMGGGLQSALREPLQRDWQRPSAIRLAGESVEQRQIDDLVRFSLPSLLRYEDRNSMAFGIEARVPFLDYRLVEAMLRLSPDMKLANGRTKTILRRSFRGVVPDIILDRRDKLGFAPPQQAWLRGRFGDRMRARFGSKEFRLGHLVDPDAVSSLLDGKGSFASAGQSDAFRVFNLDCWASEFGVTC